MADENKQAGAHSDRKVGVYICHCGGNISDHVDVNEVCEKARQNSRGRGGPNQYVHVLGPGAGTDHGGYQERRRGSRRRGILCSEPP